MRMLQIVQLEKATPTEFYLFIAFVIAFFLVFALVTYFQRRKKRRAQEKRYFHAMTNRWGLTPEQERLVKHLLPFRGRHHILELFHEEELFERAAEKALEYAMKRGRPGVEIAELNRQYAEIRLKIPFTKKHTFNSRDMRSGAEVKLWIEGKGYFTGRIIHNDDHELVVSLPPWDVPGKELKADKGVILYYWDQSRDYEFHTHIRKVSRSVPHHLSIPHQGTMKQGQHPRGMGIGVEFPVYYEYIFPEAENDEERYGQVRHGTLVTLSIIGAELRTRYRIVPDTLCLFEFSPPSQPNTKFHFSGSILEVKKEQQTLLAFVRFLDMDESCREFVHSYVCRRIAT